MKPMPRLSRLLTRFGSIVQRWLQRYGVPFFLTLVVSVTLWNSWNDRFQSSLANEPRPQSSTAPAPLFEELGQTYHYAIATRSPLAQRYFDQGLVLYYGFNQGEAIRAFQAAVQLDPDCAMCHWGVALALGPNINASMSTAAGTQAWAAIQQAQRLSQTAQERDYAQALAQRYAPKPPSDRTSLNRAYMNAMRQLMQRYPDDLDVATLFAEAIMDLSPWWYWNGDKPKPETVEMLAALESVLARNPQHLGANHFYIHAVESSPIRKQAIPSAERLLTLVPSVEHLVHMPSHIFMRVGRYHDASTANERAVAAETTYRQQTREQGFDSRLGQNPHNYHFLWGSASLEGRSKLAIWAAQEVAKRVNRADMATDGMAQHYLALPLYALTQFAQWDTILSTPTPDAALLYPTGVWHYARGMALAAKQQFAAAERELQQLRAIAAKPALKHLSLWGVNPTSTLLQVATADLAGAIAAKQGDLPRAIEQLQQGIEREDSLSYIEPAAWHAPLRQALGAVLLQAGRASDAEQVYLADLERHADNGWSLLGLAQSLQAQGKTQAAQTAQQRFEQAWTHADVSLTTSRL